MSNDSNSSVWVSDLDGYISIDAICADYEREAEENALQRELDEIGDLPLLAGKATSARQLNHKEITPSDWRHAVHQAEMAIGSEEIAELRFIRSMLDLGRSYAVARYARREHLDYPSAITATLPYGIRALLNQFLAAEQISRSSCTDEQFRLALNTNDVHEVTAYQRTGALQATLYSIADVPLERPLGPAFHRNRTRAILSLVRLYFSVIELRLSSLQELRSLMIAYATLRNSPEVTKDRLTSNGKNIRGWRLRHMRSLLDLYPYSIRHGLMRAMKSSDLTREAIVNELALAHCEIQRMRRAGRNRTRSI